MSVSSADYFAELERLSEGVFGKFYKFRSATDEFTPNIIANQALWFADPRALNDPFEARPYVSWLEARTEAELKDYLYNQFKTRHPELGHNRLKAEANHRFEILSDPATRHDLAWEVLANSTGICSMSRDLCSHLQWSHYGDEHKGLCFEFTRTTETDYTQCFPVSYEDQRPKLDFVQMQQSGDAETAINFFKAVSTKSTAWLHESEVRLLKLVSGEYKFPKGYMTGVYFGVAMPDCVRKMYLHLLRNSELRDVPLYEMKLSSETYDMTHHELER